MKTCPKCKRELSREQFSKRSKRKDGLNPWCRGCVKQYNRAYQKTYRKTESGRANDRECAKVYRGTIHGHLQRVYYNMKTRCTNPKYKGFHRYGGRGIKVCFKTASDFVDYATNVLKIDPRGLQCDRIDNDGDYEKGNIRFVTAKVNSDNRG